MAVTENSYTGNGSTTNYSFTFPYLKSTDVQVQVDATVTTAWTFANATTVQFNTAPTNGAKIKILRDTNVDSLAATFYAGSAIKSEDLNDNYTQNLYKTQEVGNRYFSTTGGTMTGDLTLGEDVTLTFEGATDDAHETKLTVADPTADRTITLPNVTGTVVTTGDTGTVAHAMLAGDAVDGDNIANDSINSEHYVDGSIDTAHIADSQVTTAKIADSNVTTAKIADSNVTTAKIANDAINGTKIADDSINSEHYVDASIDTAHIADSQITTAKIADDNVTADKLAHTSVTAGSYTATDITVDAQGRITAASSGAIATSEITDGAVTTAKLGADSVTGAKIADDAVDSEHLAADSIDTEHYAAGSVDTTALGADAVTNAKIADNSIDSEHYINGSIDTQHVADNLVTTVKLTDSNVTTAKIAADAITGAKIADDAIDSEHYVAASVDTTALSSNAVTTGKITDSNVTTAKIADSNVTLAKLASDLKQTSISDSDTQLPTSGAVVDYVAAQIAPLGGLEVIATEVAFPNTQPASGVVISISDAGGVVFNGSGVSTTGRTVGGSTVTINGAPSSLYSETLVAGVGLMVSSTGSSQTYNYHKILGKEDDIKQLSDDINDFNARYRVGSSNPTSNNDSGDMFFNTSTGKMMVYDGTQSAWEEVQSIGNFYISTFSESFDGSRTAFTVSNAPTNAQQLVISINGVIQKPNSGTGQPSEGFTLSGSTVTFSSAIPSGSDYFAIVLGSAVNIGTPSDGTVSTAKLANGAVTTVKLADANVTTAKIADDAVVQATIADASVDEARLQISNSPTNGYFLSAQSGNTGGLTWAQVTTDLVGDTSPQLGGDLASNGNDIVMADNDKIKVGNGNDLQIFRNSSSQNIIDNVSGNLLIKHGTESHAVFIEDGGVELYHDNSKVFETLSAGGKIYNLSGEARLEIQGYEGNGAYLQLNADDGDDNADYWRVYSGTSGDFYIQNFASGSWETSIDATANGNVRLMYDNSKKFETISGGSKTTGYHQIDSYSGTAGHGRLDFGNSGTPFIRAWDTGNHGSGSKLEIVSGDGDDQITCKRNGAVELFYDGTKRLETLSTGAYVAGTLGVGDASNPGHSYNQGIHIHASGTGAVLHLTDSTSGSAASDGFDVLSHNGSAYLWQRENANMIFGTNGTSRWNIYGSNGHFVPNANNTYDIGTSSNRIRNFYTNDLHLSNEGSSNDVDSTWGDWTIQEGESDLFLKNNRSGKKYKFNLTEVS